MSVPAWRPSLEVADIVRTYASAYRARHPLSPQQARVLRCLAACRTAALGGHVGTPLRSALSSRCPKLAHTGGRSEAARSPGGLHGHPALLGTKPVVEASLMMPGIIISLFFRE